MNDEALREAIECLLQALANGELEDAGVCDDEVEAALRGAHCRSFGDAMLLTDSEGCVLHLADGSEFQITVVQSKEAHS